MKCKEVKITKRFATGDYEFDEISVTLDINEEAEDGDIEHLIKATKEEIVRGQKEVEENGKTNSTKVSGKNGKSAGKKDEGSDDEGAEDDETANAEASDDDNDSPEDAEGGEGGEESEDAEEEEAKPAKKGKASNGKSGSEGKKEGKKSFKRKPQHYDRSIEAHKEVFAELITAIKPDWSSSQASKKKAKEVSEAVEGEPFLDGDGEVLDTFKARVKKLFK